MPRPAAWVQSHMCDLLSPWRAEIAGVVVSEAEFEQFVVVGKQIVNHLEEIR